MARSNNNSRQRDFSNPNNQSLDSLLTFKLRPAPVLIPVPSPPTRSAVLSVGDRRQWQPDRSTRPPHSLRPGASRVMADAYKRLHTLKFADPRFVGICVRRKIRREVLHALKRTKKGSGGAKRRNFWSDISC